LQAVGDVAFKAQFAAGGGNIQQLAADGALSFSPPSSMSTSWASFKAARKALRRWW
jgi:hypothetical protein